MAGGYRYNAAGELYFTEIKHTKDGKPYEEATAIANHAPILKARRIVDDGLEQTEELVFNAYRAGRRGPDTIVTKKDLRGSTPDMAFPADCYIYPGRGYISRYRECLHIQCADREPVMLYRHTGYAIINGERVFLNGGNSVIAKGLTDAYAVDLPDQLGRYRFLKQEGGTPYRTLLETLPTVGPAPLVYAGLGYAFLTPLNALLRELDIEPSFILYFTGRTGSGKSTFATILLHFFGTYGRLGQSPANSSDTANAIEVKLALTDSTLVLADDIIPASTLETRAKMAALEQRLARMIGDRSGRGRLNADSTLKKTYRPVCNLIVTAEDAYANVGESAIARSISVPMHPGILNFEIATTLQRRGGDLNACMSAYIQYVLAHWEAIKQTTDRLFLEYRDKAQRGGHARLAETVAHLQIGIYFLCEWLTSAGAIDKAQAAQMQAKAWEVFIDLADQQNRRITEEAPVNLFLSAVRSMLENGDLRIVQPGTLPDRAGRSVYEDDTFYYFDPHTVYVKTREFYEAQGRVFPLGKAALWGQLADVGAIETGRGGKGQGRYTKLKRFNGRDPVRFLWLKKSALKEAGEDE